MKKIINYIKGNFYLRILSLVVGLTVILIMLVGIYLKIYTHHGQALSIPDVRGFTTEEAGRILKERKLKYEIIDSVFVNFAKGGEVVDQFPDADYKVKINRTVFLTINAYSPNKVVMTNVVGLSYNNAIAELKRRGLVVGELILKPDLAQGMVLAQLYKGNEVIEGDTLLMGSVIDLMIGKGLSNKRVLVPDLLSLSISEAKDILHEKQLNLTEIYDNSVLNLTDTANAKIFNQRPGSGSTLLEGSYVDVFATIDSTKLPGYDSLVKSLNENEMLMDL